MALIIEELEETIDVYDITVKDNDNFYANDILVHNCTEITLPTKPLSDINDGAPQPKIIKLSKENYKKYLEWKKDNPNTHLKR